MKPADRRSADKTYQNLMRRPRGREINPYRGSEIVDEILEGMGQQEDDDHKLRRDVSDAAFGRRKKDG
jgi:hypothetical protein